MNIEKYKIDFDKLIEKNRKKLFRENRNADLVEALMEFGALVCELKNPNCINCCLNKTCKYFKSNKKIWNSKKKCLKLKTTIFFVT